MYLAFPRQKGTQRIVSLGGMAFFAAEFELQACFYLVGILDQVVNLPMMLQQ